MANQIIFNPTTAQLDFIGSSTAPRYIKSFNATTDWDSPGGGIYTIAVAAIVHGVGVNPNVAILELVAPGVFEQVFVDSVVILSTGHVTISVPQSPDLRFAGKLIIS